MDRSKSNTRPRARALRLRTPLEQPRTIAAQCECLDPLCMLHTGARIAPHPLVCIVCSGELALGLYSTCGSDVCVGVVLAVRK